MERGVVLETSRDYHVTKLVPGHNDTLETLSTTTDDGRGRWPIKL
jgi:hypothetical protein